MNLSLVLLLLEVEADRRRIQGSSSSAVSVARRVLQHPAAVAGRTPHTAFPLLGPLPHPAAGSRVQPPAPVSSRQLLRPAAFIARARTPAGEGREEQRIGRGGK
jgi:hypothetical protein